MERPGDGSPGGDVFIRGGTSDGHLNDGHVKLVSPNGLNAILDLSPLISDQTFTFPNKTGTFALTSDIGTPKGQVTLNFGATPGTNIITTTVVDANAKTGSVIIAQMPGRATATHNIAEHQTVPIKLSVGNIVDGVSFDLTGVCEWRLDGIFNVDYIIV